MQPTVYVVRPKSGWEWYEYGTNAMAGVITTGAAVLRGKGYRVEVVDGCDQKKFEKLITAPQTVGMVIAGHGSSHGLGVSIDKSESPEKTTYIQINNLPKPSPNLQFFGAVGCDVSDSDRSRIMQALSLPASRVFTPPEIYHDSQRSIWGFPALLPVLASAAAIMPKARDLMKMPPRKPALRRRGKDAILSHKIKRTGADDTSWVPAQASGPMTWAGRAPVAKPMPVRRPVAGSGVSTPSSRGAAAQSAAAAQRMMEQQRLRQQQRQAEMREAAQERVDREMRAPPLHPSPPAFGAFGPSAAEAAARRLRVQSARSQIGQTPMPRPMPHPVNPPSPPKIEPTPKPTPPSFENPFRLGPVLNVRPLPKVAAPKPSTPVGSIRLFDIRIGKPRNRTR